VSSEAEAIAAVERTGADVVVLEIQLPVDVGLATIAALRRAYPSLTLVVCSFLSDRSTQQLATDAGADAYLVKPVGGRELRISLAAAVDKSHEPDRRGSADASELTTSETELTPEVALAT
jgi:DNA-binding response OmpR family regulator